MTRTFKMNGKTYNSMMDIARELGVKRVYPKDFEKLGITEITGEVDTTTVDDKNSKNETVETVDTDVATEDSVAKDDTDKSSDDSESSETALEESQKKTKKTKTKAVKAEKLPKKHLGTDDEIKYAQDNVSNMNIIEFNDYIKHFSVEALVKLAENADVDTWEKVENEPIRKMHLLMDIKAHYYPTDKTPVRPKSNWKKISLSVLMNLAKENDVEFRESEDVRIQRMWVIFALNAAGLTPQDLKTNTEEEVADENA